MAEDSHGFNNSLSYLHLQLILQPKPGCFAYYNVQYFHSYSLIMVSLYSLFISPFIIMSYMATAPYVQKQLSQIVIESIKPWNNACVCPSKRNSSFFNRQLICFFYISGQSRRRYRLQQSSFIGLYHLVIHSQSRQLCATAHR